MTTRDHDVLAEAMRALRETQAGAVADPSSTKDRILFAARTQRQRRLRLVRIVLPIAALLIGSVAWAAATGRLPALFHTTGGSEPAPSPRASVVAPGAPSGAPTVEVAIGDLPNAPDTSPDPGPAGSGLAPQAPRTAPSGAASGSASVARSSREETLYEEAHRRHFVERSPEQALSAWDAYLSEFPRGRFAPEARYNRALTLVRLGRRVEAKQALTPFARGEYGGYRQREAEQLIEKLGAP